MALWILSGTTRVSRYQKKHLPNHTYRGHQSSLICFLHLLQSMASSVQFMCMTVFFHNLSKFSLVYLLAWHPPLHTPYISSPNHCLLFAALAHTITTCFVVVPRLCHLNHGDGQLTIILCHTESLSCLTVRMTCNNACHLSGLLCN